MLLCLSTGAIIGIVIAVIVVAAIVAVIAWGIKTYNNLVTMKNRVENAFSQINVSLKTRYDLIPNLVETVKGYASHEKETLSDVTRWRNQSAAATTNEEKLEAAKGLSGALSRLLVTVERYPELKANTEFAALRNELSSIENKIAKARQIYNDVVYKNNLAVEHFPSNIIANMFKFSKATPFEIDEESKEAPKVSF